MTFFARRLPQLALQLLLLAAIAAAAVFSIRLAWADYEFRRGTPESVLLATRIRPSDTRMLLVRALQVDYEGGDSRPLLEIAAALNPLSSAPRIRLGLAAEIAGDYSTAERWLLEAARVDHQYEPSWTLANFYFRQGRREDFLASIRSALSVSYGDRNPAFDLCWRMMDDASEILDRAIPGSGDVLAAYVYYLLDRHPDLDASDVLHAAEKLLRFANTAQRSAAYAACDRLINLGDAAAATVLWGELDEADPHGVFNGSFQIAPSGQGFDWRLAEGKGIVHTPLDANSGHRIQLSGEQSESAELLRHVVLLDPGKRYTLSWRSRTAGIHAPSGLMWRLGETNIAVEPSSDWQTGSGVFRAEKALSVLTLLYQRPAGQVRAEGSVDITNVSIVQQ